MAAGYRGSEREKERQDDVHTVEKLNFLVRFADRRDNPAKIRVEA